MEGHGKIHGMRLGSLWEKLQRTRTGRGAHDRIQRNGRGPDAYRTRAEPFLPPTGARFRRRWPAAAQWPAWASTSLGT
eukprot:gene21582-biopygen13208